MAGGDQIADHIQPGGGQEQLPEQPPPQVPKPELQRRIVIMFSGKTGTVVRSGDVAATSAPTYQIIIDIFEEMDELEKRSPALFDKHAKHRPCGLLDKYGAAGMLVGDVLGLPLMPWELAEKVGKAAAKLPAQLTGEKKKAKLAAKRNGMPPHSTPPHPTLPNPTCCIPSHPPSPHPMHSIPFQFILFCPTPPPTTPPHPRRCGCREGSGGGAVSCGEAEAAHRSADHASFAADCAKARGVRGAVDGDIDGDSRAACACRDACRAACAYQAACARVACAGTADDQGCATMG